MSQEKKELTKNKQVASILKKLTAKDLGLSESERKTVSPESFSIAVRTLLQNWRQGTVAAKGRSQVAGSNRKPWKQKGTGRARAGDAQSPIWRGGGVVFGPQKRVKQLKTTKQMRKKVANALMWNALDKGTIVALDWALEGNKPQTKQAFSQLTQAGLNKKHINVFITSQDVVTAASFTNIPSVRVLFFDAPNVYDLSDASHWVVLKKDIESFKEMVARWI